MQRKLGWLLLAIGLVGLLGLGNDTFDTADYLGELTCGGGTLVADDYDIDPPDDVDFVKFYVPCTMGVEIETTGPSGGDTVMALYDEDQNLIEEDDDDGEGLYSFISITLAPGYYYVRVHEFGYSDTIYGYDIIIRGVEAGCAADYVEIRNVRVEPEVVPPGGTFTVSFEYSGTGPDYPYEFRWVSETDGGEDIVCHVGDATPCQWHSDSFTLTAPTTPGTYTWYVAGYGSAYSSGMCGGGYDDNEAFTFQVSQGVQGGCAADYVEIRNVRVEPEVVPPGGTFTVSFEYRGTGPDYPYEFRWVSETDGGEDIVCHVGDATPCQWHSDSFTLTAPTTPGTYTWYVAGYGSSFSSGMCGGGYDDNEAFTFQVGQVGGCQEVEPNAGPLLADELCQVGGMFRISASIDPAGDIDWFYFNLSSSRNVIIETSGPRGDTVIILYDDDLDVLAYDDDSGTGSFSRIQIDLGPGTYYVAVLEYGSPNVIPEYELTVR